MKKKSNTTRNTVPAREKVRGTTARVGEGPNNLDSKRDTRYSHVVPMRQPDHSMVDLNLMTVLYFIIF
jgi:hypothetical protein